MSKTIIDLLKVLVCTPSQVAVNDTQKIVHQLSRWLSHHNVSYDILGPIGRPRALVINPPRNGRDETLLLNACLDTAPVGDLTQWKTAPFGGVEKDGWLYGRGSADSKAAVAIFSELAATIKLGSKGRRRISIVFDCDEHSGKFGGIKEYTARFGFPKYCAIGYPGAHKIIAGSRGFYRTTITLRGNLGHSGSGAVPSEKATQKLARIIDQIETLGSKQLASPGEFPIGPRGSITWIHTGTRTFSITASKIECGIDIRLTPEFGPSAAKAFLDDIVANIERDFGHEHSSNLSLANCWPAFLTPSGSLLPNLLQSSALQVLGTAPPLAVSGPSNIGNFLSMHGTEVLAGFGVEYKRIHGPDECVKLTSIKSIRDVYALAGKTFLANISSDG